jgi:hypothetical protein
VQQTISPGNTARNQFLDKAKDQKENRQEDITYYTRGRLEKPLILQTVRKKFLTC